MAKIPDHTFGGDWTEVKLGRLRDYLSAYSKIMTNQAKEKPGWGLKFAYIDAFAGTGYRTEEWETTEEIMLPTLEEPETRAFREGSAEIALQIEPPFSQYIFVEKNPKRCAELENLKKKFQAQKNIQIEQTEANLYIRGLCRTNWKSRRAVLFLDPYGMQVDWKTIEEIAATKAIDLWYLFPGMAVTRLLRKDGKINKAERARLDDLLGTEEWFDEFYEESPQPDFFDPKGDIIKKANFSAIAQFLNRRLGKLFAGVAPNPLHLKNTKNSTLFLLCFAAANPKAAPTAVRIAKHILEK